MKRSCGRPVHAINSLEAKRLLAHGSDSAARIADRLGFSSATNFSTFVHRHTGKSPLEFRRTIRSTRTSADVDDADRVASGQTDGRTEEGARTH